MIYLTSFTFPSEDMELKYAYTTGDASYPFRVLSVHNLRRIDFEPITILYGSNGSGKSTALKNSQTEKTPTNILLKKSATAGCIYWMSRKTAFHRRDK